MSTKLKIVIAAILCTSVLTGEKICQHLGFGQAKTKDNQIAEQSLAVATETIEEETLEETVEENGDYFVTDSVYQWDEQLLNWVSFAKTSEYELRLEAEESVDKPLLEPIKLTWEQLTNIRYQLRYFQELEMEIYSPVFPKAIKDLDGKEIP